MGEVNTAELAVCAALALAGVGWLAIHLVRAGFDYASSRGNPRNKAAAHDTLFDVGKGALLIFGAPAIAAFIFATVHFG
jgi:hypothetical protein